MATGELFVVYVCRRSVILIVLERCGIYQMSLNIHVDRCSWGFEKRRAVTVMPE